MGVHAPGRDERPVAARRIGDRLATALDRARIVEVVAGPGWGKSTQLREFARGRDAEVVELTGPVRTTDVAALGPDGPGGLLVLDGAEHLLCVPGVVEAFARRLAATDRRVLVGTRRHLRVLSAAVADGTAHVLTERDLRLTDDEVHALARRRGRTAAEAVSISAAMGGWPAGTALLARFPTTDATPQDLLADYLDGHVLDGLGAAERDFLVTVSVLDRVTFEGAAALVGVTRAEVCWAAVRARHLPLVTVTDDELRIARPLLARLRAALSVAPTQARGLRRRWANHLVSVRRFGEAARVLLDQGDTELAVCAVEAEVRTIDEDPARWAALSALLERLDEDLVHERALLVSGRLRCLHREQRMDEAIALVRRLEAEGRMGDVARADPCGVAFMGWTMAHRPREAEYFLDAYEGDQNVHPVRFMIGASSGVDAVSPPVQVTWGSFDPIVGWGLVWQGRLAEVVTSAFATPEGTRDNANLVLASLWGDRPEMAEEAWRRIPPERRERPHATYARAAMHLAAGRDDEAFRVIRDGLPAARESGGGIRHRILAGFVLLRSDAVDAVDDAALTLDACLREADQTGQRGLAEFAGILLAAARLAQGRPGDAAAVLDTALTSLRRGRRHLLLGTAAVLAAEAGSRLGRPDDGGLSVAALRAESGDRGSSWWEAQAYRLAARGRPAVAVAPVEHAPVTATSRPVRVRIHPFGDRPHLTVDGVEAPIRRLKLIELAADLAHHPEGAERSVLQARLFPEGDRGRSANHFRQVLFKLREATGLAPDATGPGRIVLPPGQVESDDRVFEDLVRRARDASPAEAPTLLKSALDLVTGPFLPASDLEWVADRRHYLDVLFTDSVMALIRAATAAGKSLEPAAEPEEIVDTCKRLIAVNPYGVDAYALLIRTHLRLGNRAAAVACYRSAVTALSEIGLEPPTELAVLVR